MRREKTQSIKPREPHAGGDDPSPEKAAVHLWIVHTSIAGFFGMLAVLAVGLWFLAPSLHQRTVPPPPGFGEPRLLADPVKDYREWRATQMDLLDGQGAENAKNIVPGDAARLPINDAMREIAARGRAAYDPLGPRESRISEAARP